MAGSRNILEDIFSTPEEGVEQFVDALDELLSDRALPTSDESTLRQLVSGKPDKVQAPKDLTHQVSGFIRIFSGWHNDDYVWHMEPAAIKRPWKVSMNRVIYAAAKTFNEVIPKHVEVLIFEPPYDWEMKTLTFKALDLAHVWSISDSDLEKLTNELFGVLNPLV